MNEVVLGSLISLALVGGFVAGGVLWFFVGWKAGRVYESGRWRALIESAREDLRREEQRTYLN